MIRNLRSFVSAHLRNILGWTTNQKIIVIESDDWGSNRMPDKTTYNYLLSKGIKVDKCPFCKFDSIASNDDLGHLFETLAAIKTSKYQSPIITFNVILANPDFAKIKEDRFEKYSYETFEETSDRYSNKEGVLNMWKQGISNNLIDTALHGREHIQINRWMKYLQGENKHALEAFNCGVYGISTTISDHIDKSILAAFDEDNANDYNNTKEILEDGIKLYKKIIGKPAVSFIAPNYVYSSDHHKLLHNLGVNHIQTNGLQQITSREKAKGNKNIRRIGGEIAHDNQIFTVRNCTFEPSISNNIDHVGTCLKQISIAFKLKKPAIINSHRLNFIGSIDESNRIKNMKLLKSLLSEIIKKWPDVVFMSSNELYTEINNSRI
jgi:hypothetical protein